MWSASKAPWRWGATQRVSSYGSKVRSLLALPWLLACTEPVDDTAMTDPCAPGETPGLTIGKGELAFESLEGDPETELIHGPQGGYHVNLAFEAIHLDPSAQWTFEMTGRFDGEPWAENSRYVTMRCNPSVPALQAWGVFLIAEDEFEPEDLHGRHSTVEVSATDGTGATVSAETEIDIFDPALE